MAIDRGMGDLEFLQYAPEPLPVGVDVPVEEPIDHDAEMPAMATNATFPEAGIGIGDDGVPPSPVEVAQVAGEPLGTNVEQSAASSEETPAGQDAPPDGSFAILGENVRSRSSVRIDWSPGDTFEGVALPTPVLVVHGRKPGPVLCLTAAVHGDELNGVEIIRRVVYDLDPDKLTGTLVAVPIVNLQGFQRMSRYLPDRRDLNRFFPGSPTGSAAARIAYSFFSEVISHCDALVDLHTGSFHRTNLPQLRADLRNVAVVRLTHGFGATVVLQSKGGPGTLRRAATDAGIPAITLEAGEPLRLREEDVKHGVKGIQTLLADLGMYKRRSIWGAKEPVYYTSRWIRAEQGGFLFSDVKVGRQVRAGDRLGVITDPITNEVAVIRSPVSGRVLGMALNQVVMPGFAVYRIGIETSDSEAAEQGEEEFSEHSDSELLSALSALEGVDAEDSE
ncbi:MAG: succinylglutamate desuccinylase [Gammaproteobacteria bacterium]|nr:MAG: succinylglutamate desuccinylase [Gammaproteobacteria bacterium]